VSGDVLVCHLVLDASNDTGMTASATANSIAADGSTSAIHANNQTAGYARVFWWLAPASGTYNVVTTISGGTPGGIAQKVFAIAGSNNSTPTTATFAPAGTGTTTAMSITSPSIPSGGIGLTLFGSGSVASSTGQTQLNIAGVASSTSACGFMAESSTAGAGSTVNFTGTIGSADWYAAISVVFAQAGGVNTAQGLADPNSVDPPGALSPIALSRTAFNPTYTGPTQSPPSGPPFVTNVSNDNTYFVDQYGNPILSVVDHEWELMGWGGGRSEFGGVTPQSLFDSYTSIQATNGFNAVLVETIDSDQGGPHGPFTNGNTWDGVAPWGAGGIGDLNPTYWSRLDYLINSCAAQGITVFLGLISSYNLATGTAFAGLTTAQATTYGNAIGMRYKNFPNLVYVFGVDYFGTFEAQFANVVTALRSVGDKHIVTCEYMAESETRKDSGGTTTGSFGTGTLVNYDDVYTYNVSYVEVEKSYQQSSPTRPTAYFNGRYDQSPSGYDTVQLDDVLWALTSGAHAVFYGSEATWAWPSTAYSHLTTDTSRISWYKAMKTWFASLTNWQNLIPDIGSAWIASSRGTKLTALASGGGATAYTGGNTYLTGAKTAAGDLAVLYTPTTRTITINTAVGNRATWVDPYSFATTSATGGLTSYTPPGNNSQGNTRWLLLLSTASGTIASIGIATENDSALAVGKQKVIGIAIETDSSLTLGRVKVRLLGIASETDSALVVTSKKLRALGIATETDSGLPVSKKKPITLALENDSAIALTRRKSRALGIATENDSAIAVTGKKSRAVGIATENDSAITLSRKKAKALGISTENDSALTLGRKKPVVLASETDNALNIVRLGALTGIAGTATENDSARIISFKKPITLASENDTALAITRRRSYPVGVATEADLARVIGRARSLGIAAENDLAITVTHKKAKAVGVATEADVAMTLNMRKGALLATENDSALTIVKFQGRFAATATETDIARQLGKRKPLTFALEADSAIQITSRKTRAFALATENDSAPIVRFAHARTIGVSAENDTARILSHAKRSFFTMSVEIDTAPIITHPGGPDPNAHVYKVFEGTYEHVEGSPQVRYEHTYGYRE
jgi:hypothetical protein